MTDGRTDGRTDRGNCNIPDAFLKSVGIIKIKIFRNQNNICLILFADIRFCMFLDRLKKNILAN